MNKISEKKHFRLDGAELKLIALAAMTIDHIGLIFFPGLSVFRIIGRIAYPIFAYMIAEGCRYTRNKKRYLSSVFGVGLLCSAVNYLVERSLYQCILITFGCSILIIFALDTLQKENARRKKVLTAAGAAAFLIFLYYVNGISLPGLSLPGGRIREIFLETGFRMDYGFFGILSPAAVWMAKTKTGKLSALAAGLCLISGEIGGVQIFSLAALIPLAFYSGRRGKTGGKNFFYVYYPAHLAVLYGIAQLIQTV